MTIENENVDKPDFTEEERAKFTWLLNRYEDESNRRMLAEKFLLEIAEMNWWIRLFKVPRLILTYFDFVHDKWKW